MSTEGIGQFMMETSEIMSNLMSKEGDTMSDYEGDRWFEEAKEQPVLSEVELLKKEIKELRSERCFLISRNFTHKDTDLELLETVQEENVALMKEVNDLQLELVEWKSMSSPITKTSAIELSKALVEIYELVEERDKFREERDNALFILDTIWKEQAEMHHTLKQKYYNITVNKELPC